MKLFQLLKMLSRVEVKLFLFLRLIYRLDKALIFFENNFHSVNVDGLFGIRIAEGMFYLIIIGIYNLIVLTLFFKAYF